MSLGSCSKCGAPWGDVPRPDGLPCLVAHFGCTAQCTPVEPTPEHFKK